MKNCLAETKTNNFDVTVRGKDVSYFFKHIYLSKLQNYIKTLYTKNIILSDTVIKFEFTERGLSAYFVLNFNSGSVRCDFDHDFWKQVSIREITYPLTYYIKSSYLNLFKCSKQYMSHRSKFLKFRSYGDDILFSGSQGIDKYLLECLPSYTLIEPMPQEKKELVESRVRCMYRITYTQIVNSMCVFYIDDYVCSQNDKITFTFVKDKPITAYFTKNKHKEYYSLFDENTKPLMWNHEEECISVEYLYAAFMYVISCFGTYDIRSETPVEIYITDVYDMCLYFKYNNVGMNIRLYSGITLKELKKDVAS